MKIDATRYPVTCPCEAEYYLPEGYAAECLFCGEYVVVVGVQFEGLNQPDGAPTPEELTVCSYLADAFPGPEEPADEELYF